MITVASLRGHHLGTGQYDRPASIPYIWRDPAASRRRLALARSILAVTAGETDAWDMPPTKRPDGAGLGRGRKAAYLLKGCGTNAAYRRHLRNGEKPCSECTYANRRRIYGSKKAS